MDRLGRALRLPGWDGLGLNLAYLGLTLLYLGLLRAFEGLFLVIFGLFCGGFWVCARQRWWESLRSFHRSRLGLEDWGVGHGHEKAHVDDRGFRAMS